MRIRYLALSFFLLICSLFTLAAEKKFAIKDTESSTHGSQAAGYEIVDTYQYPNFSVVQFNLAVLSHYSYLIISGTDAIIVDPGRDISAYLSYAKQENLTFAGCILTHSHADFIAGHMEISHAANCPVYINEKSQAQYKFTPVRNGSTLEMGGAFLKFLETPGHTPDGTCITVSSVQNKETPLLVFTGDTLFIGGVGRPDLLEGKVTASSLASNLFDSWNNLLAPLGDSVMVFPAHGAGSLCGAHLSDKPTSTIGEEKNSNTYLQHKNRSEFVMTVLSGLSDPPQYFKFNAAINRQGPELIQWEAPLPQELTPSLQISDPAQFFLVDVRNPEEYALNHIPHAVNIGLRGRFETYVGMIIPWDAKMILCGSLDDLREALSRLHRIGYHADIITFEQWKQANLPIASTTQVTPLDLHQQIQAGTAPIIVDVRLPNEWMGLRIGEIVNFPLNRLIQLSTKLDPTQPIVTVCNSAYRSIMAAGILERQGFKQAMNMKGGTEAWIASGLPVYGFDTKKETSPSPASIAQREIILPERICANELNRLIIDLPGTYDLVDIRPADLFIDYNIPSSKNVDIAALLNNPAYLTGVGPLIIACRDGSLSMAVGGILSQKTKRSIKVLYQGINAYWEISESYNPLGSMGALPSNAIPSLPSANIPPANAPQSNTQPTTPSKPKTKSAGC